MSECHPYQRGSWAFEVGNHNQMEGYEGSLQFEYTPSRLLQVEVLFLSSVHSVRTVKMLVVRFGYDSTLSASSSPIMPGVTNPKIFGGDFLRSFWGWDVHHRSYHYVTQASGDKWRRV